MYLEMLDINFNQGNSISQTTLSDGRLFLIYSARTVHSAGVNHVVFHSLSSTIRIPRNTRGETLSINYFAAVYHASVSMQNAKFPVPQRQR